MASVSVRLVIKQKWRQVGKQLGLCTNEAGTPDDQPALAVDGLGDLRLPAGGVGDVLPGGLVDRLHRYLDFLDVADADRVLPTDLLQVFEDLRVPKPGVSAQQLLAAGAGAVDAGGELLAEAQHPLLRVRRALAHPDVQHFSGVRAGREDRVIAQQPGVPVAGAALQAAADLTDEAVDIDNQPAVTGSGTRCPGALNRSAQQRVELTDMPERKRPQKRSQRRRRRDPSPEQPARAARPQDRAVIDAVGAEDHA